MGTHGGYSVCSVPSLPAPLAAWRYDGATATVVDATGNGHDFSLTGTSTRVAGYTYGGAQPGVQGMRQGSAEVQLGPAIAGLQPSALTIMTWAKVAPIDPSWFLEYFRSADNTGVFGWLFLGAVLLGRAKNPSNIAFNVNVSGADAEWNHYALTHDGSNLRAYRNSNFVGSQAMGVGVWAADTLRFLDNTGPGVTLSETRIFGSALSPSAIGSWMMTPV